MEEEKKLEEKLKEVGSKLETLPSTKDGVIKLLKQAAACLSEMDQSPLVSVSESTQPFLDAIVKPDLLKHQDRDVKLLVATCICEITRITAPEAPYSDEVLKDIFHLIVGTFSGLSDTGSPSFGRRVVILETLAKYRSCVVMLDLECNDLVNKMCSTFFTVASDDHQESVLSSMQTIVVVLIEESEDIREDLLLIILSVLGRNRNDISMAGRKLALNVIEHCAGKLEAGIKQFLISSMSEDSRLENCKIDYHEVIYDIYRCAPQILSGAIPYLTGELLTDQLDTRLKAVGLVGDLFALPGSAITETFQSIFSEFLKRLSDRVVAVRMCVLERVKSCLLSNPFRAEAAQIISALCDRLLDYDENVRKQVVDVLCDVACHALNSVPVETIKLVAERLRDKSQLVKRYTMERLAEIFRVYCVKSSDGSVNPGEFDWIPGRILRCLYDKDFRSDTIEFVLCGSLFPTECAAEDRSKHWVRVFSVLDKVEVKALEKILEQKQRLQQEILRYLSLRQMRQDGDTPEIQKKILFCFRIMSRSFAEPAKAEENFHIVDQLKDANIWKILTNLLDPSTSFHQACTGRDDLLKILGDKHRLHDFLSSLSMKCSYLLFNKEHVKEIILDVNKHNSAGNMNFTKSCLDLLVILARFSPLLLGGSGEELINFLKDDNEIIKEGALHVLAKAGGMIREQLAESSSSIDLMLERLCLEGSRRQAKYAVHALAAITKDDGLKSLSVLYKRLVDMLEEKTHLPAVLQSLGCIAQTAMPVFETRENEIEEFIKSKILERSSKPEDNTKACWDDRSELCLLKVYGLKTLVKSYLPVKDVQLRRGIDDLLEILRNVLMFGEISKDIESSSVDKAHLRFASAKAVLRLSKHWDQKIPLDLFHLTLRTPEIAFPQARKLFLGKVHQYIKDRVLDAKYACAFLFNTTGSKSLDFDEEKQNLADIIQMHQQARTRQVSVQSDANASAVYPEYIIPYLVHALAHQSCPNVNECKDVKAFEPIYRQLYLIVSMLVHKDEGVKLEAGTDKEKEKEKEKDNDKDKETNSLIVSIFQNIKCSEDVVDREKSKNSHAISELGLSIIKRLVQKEDESVLPSVSLPPMLYKTYEYKEGEEALANEGKVWLADESVLTHFESLKFETDGNASAHAARDEDVNDSEREANEVPLGKMIKQLKSQGNKGGKTKKNSTSLAKAKDAENDVDILKMVREINLDNLGLSNKFESSNGHKELSEKTKSESEHQKVKKGNITVTPVPVPKRRRSLSAHSASRLPRSSLMAPSRASEDDSSPDLKGKKLKAERTGSELLVYSIQKKKNVTSKLKGKNSELGDNGRENEVGESDDDIPVPGMLMETDKINTTNSPQSLTSSMKKRKRRSVAGLAKCPTKKSGIDIEDIIGYRIKVWWPMDKKFYGGTIKSYDPLKRKHVILYDDGDIEVLRLDKERWELVDNGPKRTKKSISFKRTPSKDMSPAPKNRSPSSLSQNKKSVTIVKKKRTPTKNSKRVYKEPKDNVDSDASSPEHAVASEGDKLKLDDPKGDHAEKVSQGMTDGEESDKEVVSISKGKHLEDTEERSNNSEESDGEEKSNFEAEVSEDMESTPQDDKKGDDGEESHSEEKEVDESSEALGVKAKKEKSDSEGNQDVDIRKPSRKPKKLSKKSSNAEDADISDDEPLSKWMHKTGNTASRR
ncbi:PREDICTED: sister chromatid cohesion protein PDS5 homolog A-B-like isoform X2 [Populus euphratica]|uniref:Sister chromatid cohesion protein PDS5 homolog A-B-like isoform X2 n=1 Tax=Populus euphratica TaxID=75702 RepID=A0AAJ6X1X4_POPEU|nr:PREDICTED: sister chromatid cohesion protein PDS5 homolog A-B-like isoform X2 [Populus euphratica]